VIEGYLWELLIGLPSPPWALAVMGTFGPNIVRVVGVGFIVVAVVGWSISQYRHPKDSASLAQPTTPVVLPPPPTPSTVTERSITWDFESPDKNWPARSLFEIAHGHGPIWVVAYKITGHNQINEPLTNISAYVIPKFTNQKMPLQIEIEFGKYTDPQQVKFIPPKGSKPFVLWGFLPIPKDGRPTLALSVEEYLKKYGGFAFVFEFSEGKLPPYEFSYSEIKTTLANEQASQDRANLLRGVKLKDQ
jgi:hypothetical protein